MAQTKRVRIAVAINADGMWAASGWHTGKELTDAEKQDFALECLDHQTACEHVVFIEADVPLPSVSEQTVKAEVVE